MGRMITVFPLESMGCVKIRTAFSFWPLSEREGYRQEMKYVFIGGSWRLYENPEIEEKQTEKSCLKEKIGKGQTPSKDVIPEF